MPIWSPNVSGKGTAASVSHQLLNRVNAVESVCSISQ